MRMNLASLGLEQNDLLVVLILFSLSRAFYGLLGVHFDASTFPHYMQFIDADLLRDRLLESLWYYHAHPPLLNLFVGVGLKIFGSAAPVFFDVCFHAMGLLVAFCVYILMLRMTSSRIAAGIVVGVLAFSPAFVLYENWLMYTLPTVAALTFAALALYQYGETRKTSWCVMFFAALAFLLLTRSLFHLAWLVLIAVLLCLVMSNHRRQILTAAAVPVLVVTLWYGKNYALFGTFSSSTMLGLGLSNIATLVVPAHDLQRLVESGRLSPFALVSRYEQRYVLFASQPYLPKSGVPVLDKIDKHDGSYNYNNQQMIAMNRVYTHDALEVIRAFPASYVLGLTISNRLFFSPPSMNVYFTKDNRLAAQPIDMLYNVALYGARPMPQQIHQPHFGYPSKYILEVNTGITLFLGWWLLLGYAYVQARRGVMAGGARVDGHTLVMGFFVVTAAYVYAVGTGFELAENYRYRYDIEPLMFVVAGVALTGLVRAARGRLTRSRAS